MYPTDPTNEARHIRLMTELKELFVQGFINADLKVAIQNRLAILYHRLINQPMRSQLTRNPDYFSTKRIVVYTSIYGSFDEVHEPLTTPDNCDFFILTDQPIRESSIWVRKDFDFSAHQIPDDSTMKNRFVKMFPELIFPDYDFSVYIDGSVEVRTDMTEFVQDTNQYGLKMFLHPVRDCIYQEIKECIRLKKGKKSDLLAHAAYLKAQHMPRHYGMLEGGMIIRPVHHEVCQKLMRDWWAEFNKYSRRDQISLPFILWKNGVSIEEIGQLGYNMRAHPAIRQYPHIKRQK